MTKMANKWFQVHISTKIEMKFNGIEIQEKEGQQTQRIHSNNRCLEKKGYTIMK